MFPIETDFARPLTPHQKAYLGCFVLADHWQIVRGPVCSLRESCGVVTYFVVIHPTRPEDPRTVKPSLAIYGGAYSRGLYVVSDEPWQCGSCSSGCCALLQDREGCPDSPVIMNPLRHNIPAHIRNAEDLKALGEF